jgi:hypothetical protein
VKVSSWLLLACALPTMMTAEVNDRDLFPAEVHGWMLAPAAETYTPEDLYAYIDGASELYISYGFRKLAARRYTRQGWPEITVDLFEMNDAGSAFGIFAHSQEEPDQEIGRDSEYLDGLLRFWQGNYYVSLLCSPETPETRTALMALGRRLAQRLPRAGERPAALALLPENGLIGASIRYFRHPAWQNTYVFLAADNILGIGPETQALLARYDQGAERPVVLLVLYPDRVAAERAFASLRANLRLPADGEAALKLADGKYLAAGLEGSCIAAVWHGGGAAPCGQLLAAVRNKIAAFEKIGG